MNFKKNLKRFMTLDRHHAEGFTLVELIVVIAILAILGGVAVPAYGGYVKKANMTADQTLVSEVADALTLYYYSHPGTAGGYVVLKPNGGLATADNDGVGEAAMIAVFGESWAEIATLKFAEWPAGGASAEASQKFTDSSYYGKEEVLLNQIGSLTNTLSDVISTNPALVGSSFGSYLDKLGYANADSQTKANAAVLYAADKVSAADADVVQSAFDTYYSSLAAGTASPEDALGNLTSSLQQELGTFGACAAIYAHAEGYAQYSQENGSTQDLLTDFHNTTINVTNPEDALTAVGDAFQIVINGAQAEMDIAGQYISGAYKEDVSGFITAMNAINSNEDILAERLELDGCYTDGTAANMLNGFINAGNIGIAEGEIAIFLDANGNIITWPSVQ